MNQVVDFFRKLFDTSDWPQRWHFGKWSEFHGWLYIVSDLLIWTAYLVMPVIILSYIRNKHFFLFKRLYVLFAFFLLACGVTHLFDAIAFWYPAYRLSALVRFITGIISWVAIFYIVKFLPKMLSFRPQYELKAEIERREKAESQIRELNRELDKKVIERTAEINDYKYALDESCIVAITNQKGIITYVNDNFCRISKYERDELIGKDHRIINSGFHSKAFIRNLWETIGRGEIWKGEIKNRAKDGSIYWVDTTIVPFLGETSKPYQYVAIRSDISARKQSEVRQLDLEQRISVQTAELAGIFERITDGFVVVDKNFCYRYANQKVGEMIGRDPVSLIGKCMWNEFPEALNTETFRAFSEAMTHQHYVSNIDYYQPLDLWQENHIYPSADGLSVFIRDITEQKRAEHSLRKSEARFRRIFDSNMVGLMFWDAEGNILETNDRLLSMIGYSRGDIARNGLLNWTKLTPPEFNATDRIALEEVRTTGVCKPIEKQFFKKDGSRIDILIGGAAIEEDGDEKGISYVLDISESTKAAAKIKKLNEELEKSEKIFRSLVENNNDVLRLSDGNFKPIYRSPNIERVTGWRSDEIEQLGDMHLMHPEDQEKAIRFTSGLQQTPGKLLHFALRMLHKQGHYMHIEGSGINLLNDPEVNGIVTNFRDVTERILAENTVARSEKTYRTIASSIPGSVICILDADYRYVLIEGDMLEKLGYSREQLLGKKAVDVLTGPRLWQVNTDLDRVFKGESFSSETKRGDIFTSSKWVPLKDELNNVYGAMVVVLDITELKTAELRIAELNVGLEQKVVERTQELDAVNKELEAFSYSVSHDLRAPLRAVNGYSNILIEDYSNILDTEGMRILQAIVKNSNSMGQLIDDLLRFSRLGRKELAIYSVDMETTVQSCIKEILPEGAQKYSLQIAALPAAPADEAMIRQVWINLISNAIKYTSKKEFPQIEIGFYPEKGMITYFIKDNGVGFDMKYANKLFGVFQRLHGNSEFEGTGVGLALVNRIIHKHNGTVWANAAVGEGATFYFNLPAIAANQKLHHE